MPNFAQAFKEEIQRIARKEVKAATTALSADNAKLKRTVAEHKRRIAELERDNKRLMKNADKQREASLAVEPEEVEKARITAKMIRGIRSRLGLTQADLAAMLDVSAQSVYQWERKEGRLSFRGGVKPALLEIRSLKKREAQDRLAALQNEA